LGTSSSLESFWTTDPVSLETVFLDSITHTGNIDQAVAFPAVNGVAGPDTEIWEVGAAEANGNQGFIDVFI
jgi:hypothetical protein